MVPRIDVFVGHLFPKEITGWDIRPSVVLSGNERRAGEPQRRFHFKSFFVEEIKRKWEENQAKQKNNTKKRLLLNILTDDDEDEDGEKDGCLICHV